MSQEIQQRNVSPYAQIGVIEAYWGDTGKRATFSIVGNNDLLTAAHVIYDPALGGLCQSFKLYLAADYNNVRNRWDDQGIQISFQQWQIDYLSDVYSDNNELLTGKEAGKDIAIIGLDTAVGLLYGQLHLNPLYSKLAANTASEMLAVGYPIDGTGMMVTEVSPKLRTPSLWMSDRGDLKLGNSGGPLLLNQDVIGVASAGSNIDSLWASVRGNYTYITEKILANDSLLGPNPATQIFDYRSYANDSAQLIKGYDGLNEIFAGGKGNDTIYALAGNDTLYGNAGKDKLFGGEGDDQLNGGADDDNMQGGGGDDSYWVNHNKDRVIELSEQGVDSVYASISYQLSNHVENLTLLGNSNINATGNALNNRLLGNTGKNSLRGGAGDDVLDGVKGNDLLIGGVGQDIFVLHLGAKPTLKDFDPAFDRIQLNRTEFDQLPSATDPISSDIFLIGSKAETAQQRLIYNPQKQSLLYDSDGNGSNQAVAIGVISSGLNPSFESLILI